MDFRHPGAVEDLTRAIQRGYGVMNARYLRAVALGDAGRVADAISEMNYLIKAIPDPQFIYLRGRLHLLNDDEKLAESDLLAVESKTLRPELAHINRRACLALAEVAGGRKQWKERP